MSDDSDNENPFDDLPNYDHRRSGHAIENSPFESDWDRELRLRNVASLSPGGGLLSDIEAEAQYRDLKAAEQNVKAPRVRINPPGSGTLGNTVTVTSGLPPLPVASYLLDDEADSTTFTVSVMPLMDASGVFPPNTITQTRSFAEIKWGNRSAPAVARVDVGKGLQLTVNGSFVAVNVGLDYAATSGTMQLSGGIGFFAAPRTAPVTRTIFIDALASGNSPGTTVIIPPWARTLSAQRNMTSWSASVLRVIVRDYAANVLYSQIYAANVSMTEPIWLSDDAYDVLVTQSNTEEQAVNLRLIFELAL